MEYRIDKDGLLDRLSAWDSFLKRKVHLIACGGTALTLLDIKPTTKDIDLVIPNESEYRYLLNILRQLGYKQITGAGWKRDDGFIFDIFPGKRIHTTELIESPLKEENNMLVKEFSHIYLGVLNYYDLLITKLVSSLLKKSKSCHSEAEGRRISDDKKILRFAQDDKNGVFQHTVRSTAVDMQDCLMLIKSKHTEINIDKFIKRYKGTVSFDISEEKADKNLKYFLKRLKKEGIQS